MCTALSYNTNGHYFGRNLDLERGYNEKVVITPRNFEFRFRCLDTLKSHYALIGTAAVVDEYPLYFEAANEKGLCMAGLNFPQNAFYYEYNAEKINIAPFELIPYFLSLFRSVKEVKRCLLKVNVINCNFNDSLPVSPLHFMISDKKESIVLECTKNGMAVFPNPYGVLTNNPTFDYHLMNLNNYMGLSSGAAENKLCKKNELLNYSLGLGALGLPGDFSSCSRFVKTVFLKENSVCDGTPSGSVNQFFHILAAVAMPKGCVMTPKGEYEYTRYSCCIDTDTMVFYYKTYHDSTVKQVKLYSVDLDSNKLYIG